MVRAGALDGFTDSRAVNDRTFERWTAYLFGKELQGMNRLRLLLAILTFPTASFAQGTFLFTWHGQSNYFQASFILTDAEMQPGATFSSPEFTNSVSINSLSSISYNPKADGSLFLGGVNPWA